MGWSLLYLESEKPFVSMKNMFSCLSIPIVELDYTKSFGSLNKTLCGKTLMEIEFAYLVFPAKILFSRFLAFIHPDAFYQREKEKKLFLNLDKHKSFFESVLLVVLTGKKQKSTLKLKTWRNKHFCISWIFNIAVYITIQQLVTISKSIMNSFDIKHKIDILQYVQFFWGADFHFLISNKRCFLIWSVIKLYCI